MKTHTTVAEAQGKSERAPGSASVVASGRACPVCGTPLRGRQESCSARCRAAKSRRGRVPVKAEELRNLRAVVRDALDWLATVEQGARTAQGRLWEATAKLDRYVGP